MGAATMTASRARGWEPERTWVFVVGTLEWQRADYFDPFPKEQRRDAALVEFFRGQGVPTAQIVYLSDRQATTKRIQHDLEQQLAKASAGDMLVLYYCGHGGKTDDGETYFASYDTDCDANQGWVVASIPATIERCFGGARALLLADCCYSGALAEAIAQQPARVGYACLTSSLASELSTGNWTFTEGLIAGLQGQAFVDHDRDGSITLRELAEQIKDTMAFAEEQIVTFATSGGFDPNLKIAAARPRSDRQLGAHVAVLEDGIWYRAEIIAVRGAQVRVHYYGYEASDDAWVARDRIRTVGRPTYPVGATVSVQWRRTWYPAVVLDARAGIHYIQYEGHGPEWNEWVALKRICPIA
jgi:Caspase domain